MITLKLTFWYENQKVNFILEVHDMGYIYIIENDVNDKVYIGQTKQTIEKRFKQHLVSINSPYKTLSKLYRAMRDIGVEHFKISILEECDDANLNDREIYYIDKYDSFYNGYNSTTGGSGTRGSYEPGFLIELLQDYSDGLSQVTLCKKYRISRNYLTNLCSGIERKEIHTNNDMLPQDTLLVMYNTDFEPEEELTIQEAYHKISIEQNKSIDKYNFYREVNIATAVGNIAYNHRWQLESELYHSGLKFRSIFDIEEFISGTVETVSINEYICCKDALIKAEIRGLSNRCRVCNKIIHKDLIYCDKCKVYAKRGQHRVGVQTEQFKEKVYRITQEELRHLIKEEKLSLTEIGKRYGVSGNAVKRWCKGYEIEYNGIKDRNSLGVTLVLSDKKLYFSTVLDAARYMVDAKISLATNLSKLSHSLSRAAKTQEKILGIYVDIGDTTSDNSHVQRKQTYQEKNNVNLSGITIILPGLEKIYFDKTSKAAQWLIDNKYTNISRLDQISYRLGKAAKDKKRFCNLDIELGDTR